MNKTALQHTTDEQGSDVIELYYDHALKKGWILPTSQRRSRIMCERILRAANRVFAEQGFAATKVSDIAAVAGCSVGIFYKRFSDKEGLFYALQHRHLKDAQRQLDRLVDAAGSPLTTHDVLYRFVRSSAKNILGEAGFERALVEMSLKDRDVWKAQQRHNRYASDRLIDFLVRRNELSEIDEDVRQRAHFAVRIVFGAVVNLVAFGPGPYEADDPRVIDNLADFLWSFVREEQIRARETKRRTLKKR